MRIVHEIESPVQIVAGDDGREGHVVVTIAARISVSDAEEVIHVEGSARHVLAMFESISVGSSRSFSSRSAAMRQWSMSTNGITTSCSPHPGQSRISTSRRTMPDSPQLV